MSDLSEREFGELIAGVRSLSETIDHLRTSIDRMDQRLQAENDKRDAYARETRQLVDSIVHVSREVDELKVNVDSLEEESIRRKAQEALVKWLPTGIAAAMGAVVAWESLGGAGI